MIPKSTSKSISKLPLTERLQETLRDEVKFESFIDWVYREFSAEVMLSVIELSQFRAYLKDMDSENLGNSSEINHNCTNIEFYKNMPQSSILQSTHSLRLCNLEPVASLSTGGNGIDMECDHDLDDGNRKAEVTRIVEALYLKYIERAAELEINVSSTLRNRWDILQGKQYPIEDLQLLTCVIEETIAEMLKYMRQSFIRFEMQRT